MPPLNSSSVGGTGNRRRVGPSCRTLRAARIRLLDESLTHKYLQSSPTIADASPQPERRSERSLKLALAAARTADDNRGQDIAVLDMRPLSPEFDYFVLATGNSRRQLHAISEEIDHVLEGELGDQRLGIEGYSESRWILLDYGSVVIHLFDAETRAYYALEDLWSTAQRVPLPWEGGQDGEKGRQGDKESG
jgi:ribosome-associated protein